MDKNVEVMIVIIYCLDCNIWENTVMYESCFYIDSMIIQLYLK